MAEVVQRPAWVGIWLLILILWAACGAVLLATGVGQQALIDERVRVIESFGGTLDDQTYATFQVRPPWWVYLTSGGRLLLTPVSTVLMATVVWGVAQRRQPAASFNKALAVVVHANVVLLIGQLIATPLHYVRESLTSPLNMATILPGMSAGSAAARMFGAIDLFGLWWLLLVAIGASVLTSQPTGRYFRWFGAVYLGFAAILAAVTAALGGI
jgi:hypothetical protein